MAPTRPRSDAGANPHARARRRITPLTYEETLHFPLAGTDGNALGQRGSTPPTRGDEPHRPHAEKNPPTQRRAAPPTREDIPPPPHTHTHTHTKMNRTARHNIAPLTMSALVGATTAQRRLSPRCLGKPSRSPRERSDHPRGEFRSSPGDVPTVPGNVPTLDSHVSCSNPPLHAERCLTTRVTMQPPARTDPSARRGEPGMCPRGFPRAGPDRRSRTRATARKDPTVG